MSVEITGIKPGGPSDTAGIRPGMKLLRINDFEIRDVFDYEYYSAAPDPVFLVETPEGVREFQLNKPQYEDVGIDFADYLMDMQRSCNNKCIFCFIDQLPKGLREPLYFKDDDERLSFLFGNYTTLTNLKDRDIDRIIEMRISPINISVHTTDPDLRNLVMGTRIAGKKLAYLYKIAEAGLDINCQIVCCRGINDGEHLKKTLADLSALYPSVRSIAVVPAGLTRYREGLYPIEPYDSQTAAETLDIIEECHAAMKARTGGQNGLVYGSDEWYLMAGRELPAYDYYDDFLQIENGVGMIATMRREFYDALKETRFSLKKYKADFITGESAADLIRELAAAAKKKFPRAEFKVHVIRNEFFGGNVTVAGLLTGKDIMEQADVTSVISDNIILPGTVLRNDGDMMLDDTTPEQLRAYYGRTLRFTRTGGEFLQAIMERN